MYTKTATDALPGVHTPGEEGTRGTIRRCMYTKTATDAFPGVHTPGEEGTRGTIRRCMYTKTATDAFPGVHTPARDFYERSEQAASAEGISSPPRFRLRRHLARLRRACHNENAKSRSS